MVKRRSVHAVAMLVFGAGRKVTEPYLGVKAMWQRPVLPDLGRRTEVMRANGVPLASSALGTPID